MTVWPDGYGRRVLTSADSTLDEAARVAGDLPGPEWILALSQTAGRGRRGRTWVMPQGNFAASLVLPNVESPAQAALRSFVASLALYDACVAISGRADAFALKWPNDVLLRGGKVAGILLESTGARREASCLAIGFGVNLVAVPDSKDLEGGAVPAAALQSTLGVSTDPESFLDNLAAAYARYETQFCAYGFAPIRTAWLQRAARLGTAITARTTSAEVHGTFIEVDGEGQLVLETPKGRVAIPAGDVYF